MGSLADINQLLHIEEAQLRVRVVVAQLLCDPLSRPHNFYGFYTTQKSF